MHSETKRDIVTFIGCIVCCVSLGSSFLIPILSRKPQGFEEETGIQSNTIDALAGNPVDVEAYHYWYAPENSFGISSTKTVNWTHFKQLLNSHFYKNAIYKRYESSQWTDGTEYLTLNRTWNESGFWKVDIILDIPVDLYSVNISFGCDLPVLNYVEREGYEIWLNYSANSTETYQIMFNWSDIAQIPNLEISKHRTDGKFWISFKRDNVPSGRYVFDPWFGYNIGSSQYYTYFADKDDWVGFRHSCIETGTVDNISVYCKIYYDGYEHRAYIYDADDLSFVGASDIRTLTSDNWEWQTFVFSEPKPVIYEGAYFLVIHGNTSSSYWYYSWQSDGLGRILDNDNGHNLPSYPDTLTNDSWDSAYKGCIYANYTVGVAENSVPTSGSEAPTNNTDCVDWVGGGITTYAIVTDTDGDTINTTWWSNSSGSWKQYGVANTTVSSGTNISQLNVNFSVDDTWYHWWLLGNDGMGGSFNDSYSFKIGVNASAKVWNTNVTGYLIGGNDTLAWAIDIPGWLSGGNDTLTVVYVDDDFDSGTSGWGTTHFDSIQNATNNVTTGGTVYIWDGTYDEQVSVSKSLDYIGNGSSTVTVQGTDTASKHGFTIASDWVNISDIQIKDFDRGITFTLVENITFDRCNITSCIGAGIYPNQDCINITIINCSISDNNDGIYFNMEWSRDIIIKNCTIENHDEFGIWIEWSNYTNISYCEIINNGNPGDTPGLWLFDCHYFEIYKCNITGNDVGNVIMDNENTYNNFTDCNLSGSLNYYGVTVRNSGNYTTFENCTISDNDDYWGNVFLEGDADYTYLLNCTINGTDYGIYMIDTDYNTIRGCNITNADYGIYIDTDGVGNIIYNNWFNNSINAFDDSGNAQTWNITKTPGTNIYGGSYLGGNYWHNYTGVDTDGDGLGDTDVPWTDNGNISTGGDNLPLTIEAGAIAIWNLSKTGYLTGGNESVTAIWNLNITGYLTGGNDTLSWTIDIPGWLSGGNDTLTWTIDIPGWLIGGNDTLAWTIDIPGWLTGGNETSATVWNLSKTGYLTAGNDTLSWTIDIPGWLSGGNETSATVWNLSKTGYLTAGNDTLSWTVDTPGWLSGGNYTLEWSIPVTGYLTGGSDLLTYNTVNTGWLSGGNDTVSWSNSVTGYLLGGNESTGAIMGTPNPENNSQTSNTALTWSIPINDTYGIFDWTINCSNGQNSSADNEANGSKTLSLTGLQYTTYTVWVNVTDAGGTEYHWYKFTVTVDFDGNFTIDVQNQKATASPTISNAVDYYRFIIEGEDGFEGETAWIPAEDIGDQIYNLDWDSEYSITMWYKNETLMGWFSRQFSTQSEPIVEIDPEEPIDVEDDPPRKNIYDGIIPEGMSDWWNQRNDIEKVVMVLPFLAIFLFLISRRKRVKKYYHVKKQGEEEKDEKK